MHLTSQTPELCSTPQSDKFLESAPPYYVARSGSPLGESSRPRMDRNISSASCAIRNPFRTQSTDSIGSVDQSWESAAEIVEPVQRTVPSHLPKRRVAPINGSPYKASIITTLDPFVDAEDSSSESDSPTTPVSVVRSKSLSTIRRVRWGLEWPMGR